MRALIFVLIIAVIALLVALASGFLNITQTRSARPPQIGTTHNGVTAKGGQPPAFEVETGSVRVGSAQKNVKVPTLQVQRPGTSAANQQAPVTNAQ